MILLTTIDDKKLKIFSFINVIIIIILSKILNFFLNTIYDFFFIFVNNFSIRKTIISQNNYYNCIDIFTVEYYNNTFYHFQFFYNNNDNNFTVIIIILY